MDKVWKWILVSVYAGFTLVYHACGDADSEAWSKAYYIWLFAVHVIMLITICSDSKEMFYRIYPLICYAVVRLMIEILTICEPLEVVNNKLVVDILLYLCVGATGLLIMKDKINEYYNRKNR
jgi:hypothetical protein